MENKEILREGWSIDVASKQMTHYYKNGKSLCTLKIVEPYMNQFDNSVNYSQVLGYTCILCSKKLKAMNEQRELWKEAVYNVSFYDSEQREDAFNYLSERYNISKK